MDQIFEKVLTGEVKVNFFGPAGGSRTLAGAEPPGMNTTWLVETEILLLVEQYYSPQGKT